MASPFLFLTTTGSASALFRHWTLVIVLTSLLVTEKLNYFTVNAEPSMILHALPDEFSGDSSTNTMGSITVSKLHNITLKPNPLVTVPLKNVPKIADDKALLTIYSANDSTTNSFVIEIYNPPTSKRQNLGETILYSFLCVTLTNLCAVTGFICIPVKRSKHFPILLSFMMSLAVSALLTTSILVLVPEAMRMVELPLEFGGQGRTYLFKMGCVAAGVFFFFILEYILLIIPRLFKWDSSSDSDTRTDDSSKNWDAVNDNSNPEISVIDRADLENSFSSSSINISHKSETILRGRKFRCCAYFTHEKFSQIAPVAWMILFGDSFHNLMDGMTIAVGFTESPHIGIALTLSILFEELPHELGDFAILISSGFSIRAAICANFLSACSAYIGLVIGLIIGEVSTGALYVFAICAGFFLYISLSDMLPELRESLEEKEKKKENSMWLFFIQCLGLLTGFGCVLGVTLASDHIAF
nr:zinc transporter ZIP14 [Hymenolepis microstoma]